MNVTSTDNIIYLLIILILIVAITIKVFCVYIYKCNYTYNKHNNHYF